MARRVRCWCPLPRAAPDCLRNGLPPAARRSLLRWVGWTRWTRTVPHRTQFAFCTVAWFTPLVYPWLPHGSRRTCSCGTPRMPGLAFGRSTVPVGGRIAPAVPAPAACPVLQFHVVAVLAARARRLLPAGTAFPGCLTRVGHGCVALRLDIYALLPHAHLPPAPYTRTVAALDGYRLYLFPHTPFDPPHTTPVVAVV